MYLNEYFAQLIDKELVAEFDRLEMCGPRNAAMSLADKMRGMRMIPHPFVTSHKKCEICGRETRHHGFIQETGETICL